LATLPKDQVVLTSDPGSLENQSVIGEDEIDASCETPHQSHQSLQKHQMINRRA